MDNLNRRVLRLERSRQVVTGGQAYGALIDRGPYHADDLVGGWARDAKFDADGEIFSGRDEIHRFFSDLAATYTIHYSTNTIVEFDKSLETLSIRAYGLEMPIIDGEALIGAFAHQGCNRWTEGRWEVAERQQRMHFLSPVSTGWDDQHRFTEQRTSRRN